MTFDPVEFRGFVGHVLRSARLHSPAAVELLLGTCAQESAFGAYRKQIAGGPALGVMQIEPDTFKWLRQKYGRRYGFEERLFRELERDDQLSVLVARLRYLVDPEPLPAADDLFGLAATWKRVFNTHLGRGTEGAFVEAYERYVVRV